ncbi:MAG: AraC family transcriptional regulator, partial [Clostridiales bacterium]|nr:AraC family transcriptional regulator [Clostridiales bacterium]
MEKSRSNRILATPSSYAKAHYLYVQEVGTLESIEPHVSSRKNLNSFLLLIVTSGKGQLTHKGQLYPLAAGDCAYINCDDPYSHESSDVEPWTLTWVHFNGKEAGAFYHNFTDQGNSPIFKPIQYDAFIECFHHLYESSKNQTFLNELLANKYLVELITLCFWVKQR